MRVIKFPEGWLVEDLAKDPEKIGTLYETPRGMKRIDGASGWFKVLPPGTQVQFGDGGPSFRLPQLPTIEPLETSPLRTNPGNLPEFESYFNSLKRPITNAIPGNPAGPRDTQGVRFYLDTSEIPDGRLPYPAYAYKRSENSFDSVKNRFNLAALQARTHITDYKIVPRLEISDVTVTNSDHGGSAGIIKLAFLGRERRPVVVKTYRNASESDEYFLNEVKKAQMLSELGIITFHGIHVYNGRPAIVTDIVPGRFTPSREGSITLSTFKELEDIFQRLALARISSLGDFQYHLTPNGHVSVIDAGGLGLPGTANEYSSFHGDVANQYSSLLIEAKPRVIGECLTYLKSREPAMFGRVKNELEQLRPNQLRNPRLLPQIASILASLQGFVRPLFAQ